MHFDSQRFYDIVRQKLQIGKRSAYPKLWVTQSLIKRFSVNIVIARVINSNEISVTME